MIGFLRALPFLVAAGALLYEAGAVLFGRWPTLSTLFYGWTHGSTLRGLALTSSLVLGTFLLCLHLLGVLTWWKP